MIGTGTIFMTFSDCEVSGSVTPQVTFELDNASVLTLDHAETFNGIVRWAEQNGGSDLLLKNANFGTNFTVTGGLFDGTTTDGRHMHFQLQTSPGAIINAFNTADGLVINAIPKA
jgi:hypothetical protein